MDPTIQYVTKNEFDIRMKNQQERTDMQISSIEKMLEKHITTMQAISDKNLAEFKASYAEFKENNANFRAEVREDISEIRGDIKAIYAKIDSIQIKFGWYVALLGIAVSLLSYFFQKF
ncbi:MAG: hypothetical protein IJM82_07785 [Synergistaceae bacterium]|nr:hypothetical protein [Synergistaceae bacterium]MBR0074352.1 hypothetical protein [Synergistaceae bacterium]MBR0233428.1 hypothetical protein [Synergistaceae bacterium]MBR0252960.1 hypothetical protein [Synergistaceae bacterium]